MKACKYCNSAEHSSTLCFNAPKKPIKNAIKPRSKAIVCVSKSKVAKVSSTKKKKASLTSAKKKLEKLVKDYVKERDNYTCQYCGKKVEGSNCHASHVIPVSRSGYLQFEPLNMKVLCYHHHINWWHKHPIEAGKWFTETFPERWEYLEELHKQRLKPMKIDEILEKIEEYKNK